MTGRFVAATVLKDVRRQLADPVGLLTWMGLPLVIGGLIVLVSGSGGSPGDGCWWPTRTSRS